MINFDRTPFKVNLKIYITKNNISWVITDCTNTQIYYKRTGAQLTKRGNLKNSQKVALQNLEYIIDALKNIKADLVFVYLKNGFGTKKHPGTYRSVLKIMETLKKAVNVYQLIFNDSAISISKTRLKGGRRGRRT